MATMEPRIFNKPRPKKSLLPPPSKKRKTDHKIEEISFDFSSREEYLTGFHKRKVQRATRAKAEAEKKAKEEKIVLRKQVGLCSFTEQLKGQEGRERL
jgi:ribosomal RNA-processing protein 17